MSTDTTTATAPPPSAQPADTDGGRAVRAQGRDRPRHRSQQCARLPGRPARPVGRPGDASGQHQRADWPGTPASPSGTSENGWRRRQPRGTSTYKPESGAFTLPVEHAAVLADSDSPAFMAAGFEVVAAVWATVDRLAHGYATGEGVGWHEHDSRLFTGFERFFRPVYRNSLVSEWLTAVPGLVDKLDRGSPRARRGLRAGHGDGDDGRGVPGVGLRRSGLPRGVGAARRIAAGGAGVGRPGFLRRRGRDVLRRRVRPDLPLRHPPRSGRPGRGASPTPGRTSPRAAWVVAVEPNAATASRTTCTRWG